MNILLLMAGGSEAFREAGYIYPKNLVEIDGQPLVQQTITPLRGLIERGAKLTCVVLKEENDSYHTSDVIRLLVPEANVVELDRPTAGAACTALLAVEMINTDEPLLLVNGDQIVEEDLVKIIDDFQSRELDGGIIVFEAVHPRWSYVREDPTGNVVETAEKRPISNLATAGIYYFKKGSQYVRAAMDMIRKDAHVGGVFYICPSYNELILEQARIGTYRIPRAHYFSLANPQGVKDYEEHLRSRQASGAR